MTGFVNPEKTAPDDEELGLKMVPNWYIYGNFKTFQPLPDINDKNDIKIMS